MKSNKEMQSVQKQQDILDTLILEVSYQTALTTYFAVNDSNIHVILFILQSDYIYFKFPRLRSMYSRNLR